MICDCIILSLRRESIRVSWEHRSEPDIREAEEKHDNSFQTNAASSMRERSILERINIRLHRSQVDALGLSNFEKHGRIVNSLGPRHDFLPSQENIV